MLLVHWQVSMTIGLIFQDLFGLCEEDELYGEVLNVLSLIYYCI